jgi:DNA-binding HxlR family transcriptional regulator
MNRNLFQPADAAPPLSERFERGDLMSVNCPSREVFRHITSRWGALVLIALEGRTRRFSELRRAIGGVSERMLAQTLQWLEADGLISRKAFDVVPPHVEYSLTPFGREATQHLRVLADWIETNLSQIARGWSEGAARAKARRGSRPVSGATPGSASTA